MYPLGPDQRLRPEVHRAHTAWLDAGGIGGGRLLLDELALPGLDVAELDLRGMRARVCVLTGGNLARTHLDGSEFDDCYFTECQLVGATMDGAVFRGCVFDRADLSQASLRDARFADCVFGELVTSGADSPCIARSTTFERCDFRGADLSNLQLSLTTFVQCKLGSLAGTPTVVEGKFRAIACDMSARGDGSVVVSQAEVVRSWS